MNSTDFELLIHKMIQYVSPAIAGVKASSLMNFKNSNILYHDLWQEHKDEIHQMLKINYYELKVTKDCSIVLFYDEKKLDEVLALKQHQTFLRKFTYDDFSIKGGLMTLKRRFQKACPHEMGIFLGYPLTDVNCFIECNKRPCLAVGYWKVYENLDEALVQFELFDQIKNDYLKRIKLGYLPSEVLIKQIRS